MTVTLAKGVREQREKGVRDMEGRECGRRRNGGGGGVEKENEKREEMESWRKWKISEKGDKGYGE